MTQRGNWGTWATIHYYEDEHKKVSCATCVHYRSDGSCRKTGYYVPGNGYGFWRHCSKFVLSEEYATPENIRKVKSVKGKDWPFSYEEPVKRSMAPAPEAIPPQEKHRGSNVDTDLNVKKRQKEYRLNVVVHFGDKVHSKQYGTGKVVTLTKDMIRIQFKDLRKEFKYPDAFRDGELMAIR